MRNNTSVTLPDYVSKWLLNNGYRFEFHITWGDVKRGNNEDKSSTSFVRDGNPEKNIGIDVTEDDRLYLSYARENHKRVPFVEWLVPFTMFIPDTEEEFLKLINLGISEMLYMGGVIECLNWDSEDHYKNDT